MPDLDNEDRKRDDGYPWGYISAEGDWIVLAKGPMLKAGYGPPPFDLTMPDQSIRRIIHQPGHGPSGRASFPTTEVNAGKLYRQTMNLRWAQMGNTLQQAWVCDQDGTIDWRDIPFETKA